MELPRGLRDQVAEHVPVLHRLHSPEYEMRTHVWKTSLSFFL